tara:strand:+ start:141 stop:785 length:645 start_codon:yes stop_codon:yes gene_type:complete
MSFTYVQLRDAIKNYTEYTETTFVANIPLFIRLSEERILKTVQLSLFRKNVTASTSGRFLRSPNDFLAPFSLSLAPSDGDKVFLDFKDPSFLQTYTPDNTTTGTPRYYCQFDFENFMLAPAPATTHTAELHYFYRPNSITVGSDSETTWLSINAEMALLYGALIEAYIYMKGEADILDMYNRRFQESMLGVKMLGEAKETTDEYRTGKVIRDKQ